jgi:hypothetical protein
MHLHGVVLNLLSIGTTLTLFYLVCLFRTYEYSTLHPTVDQVRPLYDSDYVILHIGRLTKESPV